LSSPRTSARTPWRAEAFATAFSVGEFLALGNLDGVDVVIEDEDLSVHPDDGLEEKLKLEIAREYAEHPPDPGTNGWCSGSA